MSVSGLRHESPGANGGRLVRGLQGLHETVILFVAILLLIIPKVNLIPFLVPGVGVKPEDVLVAGVSFFYLLRLLYEGPQLGHHGVTQLRWLLVVYMIYLSLVTVAYRGQLQYLGRYTLYYSLIILSYYRTTSRLGRRLETLAFSVLWAYAAVVILQKVGVMGGIHTGVYIADASTRPSLLFTNAAEAGLVSTFLLGIVLGTNRGVIWKTSTVMVTLIINYLGENRSALGAIVIMMLWQLGHFLRDSTRTKAHRKRAIVTVTAAAAAGVCVLVVFLGVFDVKRPQGRLAFTEIVSDYRDLHSLLSTHISPEVSVGDISAYAVGRSEEWDIEGDESLLFRLQKWSYALSVILAGNVFGIGAGNGIGDSMDGMAFRVLVESGVPGMLMYCLVLLSIVRALSQERGSLRGLGVALIGQLSQALFLDALYFSRPAYLFWLLFAARSGQMTGSTERREGGGAARVARKEHLK